MHSVPQDAPLILWFDEVRHSDIARVGGKNAALGEMLATLAADGVRVPLGFASTAAAYGAFLAQPHPGAGGHASSRARAPSDLRSFVAEQLTAWIRGEQDLATTGRAVRECLEAAPVPQPIHEALTTAYQKLCVRIGVPEASVAVRSSATAEDLPDASFAGQQDTFLNVFGEGALVSAWRRCVASLFTDRAITYRQHHGFDHMKVALSVGIQHMVRSDLGSAGVMFTLDTETGFPHVVTISSAWGLGENVVKGAVNPDEFTVFKTALSDPTKRPIIRRVQGAKEMTMVLAPAGSTSTVNTVTSEERRRCMSLSDDDVLQLARWGVQIEAKESARAQHAVPMDIEWAKDGTTGELFIVQARPETVQSRQAGSHVITYALRDTGHVLVRGRSVGTAIASAPIAVMRSLADIDRVLPGHILVAEMTDPDWVPIMRRAAGIITDHGGRTCHAAIVARELGIPAIVGTANATSRLAHGTTVTMSCAAGEEGLVYEGTLRFEKSSVDLAALPSTRTQLMMNLADPGAAFQWWRIPCDGIGLARIEFIISNHVRIHPMALVHVDALDAQVDVDARRTIEELTKGWRDRSQYFVERLASGVAMLAASQFPRPVVVRFSDFKTNEYANLLGGRPFEPVETNPMIGFRGAVRYISERYRDGFALECRALRMAREEYGMSNIVVMIPFCRTLAEADAVLETMAKHGLRRGDSGLQVFVMCEIPANVVLTEDFAARFDGFSIGSNDLTQLTLGVDRDSELLSSTFDENNPAVVTLIREVIRRAHAVGSHVGICGQAPSDLPGFAEMLVDAGIDSISLNPDTLVDVRKRVAAAEMKKSSSTT